MPSFGDYYNKNKKKPSKEELARKAAKSGTAGSSWVVPQPVVLGKGKPRKF